MPSCTSHASKQTHSPISITLSFLTTPVSRVFSQLTIVKSEPTLMPFEMCSTLLWVQRRQLSASIPFRYSIRGFPNSTPPRLAVASSQDKPRLNANKPWHCVVVYQVPVATSEDLVRSNNGMSMRAFASSVWMQWGNPQSTFASRDALLGMVFFLHGSHCRVLAYDSPNP